MWLALKDNPELTIRQCLVTVTEHFPLVQCFHCTDYGHTAANCRSDTPTCVYCSGTHAFSQCPHKQETEALQCANCRYSPEFKGTPRHAANDYQVCPLAQQRQHARRKQTIYDPKHYRALMHIWARHVTYSQSPPRQINPTDNDNVLEPPPLPPPSPLYQRFPDRPPSQPSSSASRQLTTTASTASISAHSPRRPPSLSSAPPSYRLCCSPDTHQRSFLLNDSLPLIDSKRNLRSRTTGSPTRTPFVRAGRG